MGKQMNINNPIESVIVIERPDGLVDIVTVFDIGADVEAGLRPFDPDVVFYSEIKKDMLLLKERAAMPRHLIMQLIMQEINDPRLQMARAFTIQMETKGEVI